MSGEKYLDARAVDPVYFSEPRDSFLLGQRLCPSHRVVRMLLEHPETELSPDFGLADALNDLDAGIAQDHNTRAVNSRMGVAHTDHDTGDSALGDRFRTRGCAAVEGARLEGGV
jgi:hypothetical protein